MRCLACNENLSDREANRKYPDAHKIKNPEDRYIMLCDPCIKLTDLVERIPLEDADYQELEVDDGSPLLEPA